MFAILEGVKKRPGEDGRKFGRAASPAAAPGLAPASQPAIDELVARLALPRRFVLYLGALEPRKNVAGLVRAIGQLRAASTFLRTVARRDNGAHRDACNPKAIRVAPIYAMRDQHHPQPRRKVT